MSYQRQDVIRSALIGGGIAGVLSAIPLAGCLFFIWIIGGAIWSAYLLTKYSSEALSAKDGVVVGIVTGIIVIVVSFIIGIPLHAVLKEGIKYYKETFDTFSNYSSEITNPYTLLGFLMSLVIYPILGIIGGVIGVFLFGKKSA